MEVLSFDDIRRDAIARRLEPASIPDVGDRLPIRVPDHARDACRDFSLVDGVVRHVGQHGIFVEDVANPDGGFTDADYAALSRVFDDDILPTLIDYFGRPTDFDGNGRIVILMTKRLNENAPEVLGFVSPVNLFPQTTCPSSNQGEYYYSVVPDPTGAFGPQITTDQMRPLAQILLAHEVTHIIQTGRRIIFPGAMAFMPLWQAEGQATLAEEVVGFHMRGRTTGQNYGPDLILEDVSLNWHEGAFVDLFTYFGFVSREQRTAGAPEQCSFLGRRDEGNDGPCIGRMAYGVSWSFLRWLSDQYGPGGEQQLHRAIIENVFADFRTIEQVTGLPRNDLLALWAASLYVDDRVPGAAPVLTWRSWNLSAIDRAVVQTARLLPRTPSASIVDESVSVRAGSTAYYLLQGSPASLRVQGSAGGPLPSGIQIWVVRLR